MPRKSPFVKFWTTETCFLWRHRRESNFNMACCKDEWRFDEWIEYKFSTDSDELSISEGIVGYTCKLVVSKEDLLEEEKYCWY